MDVTNLEQNLQKKITLTGYNIQQCKQTLSLSLGQYFWCLEDILYANKDFSH